MDKHLHLFTKVEDGLPPLYENTTVVINNNYMMYAVLDTEEWCIYYADGRLPEDNEHKVTHFLDLDKLTTKERAEKLAKASAVRASIGVAIGLDSPEESAVEFEKQFNPL